MTLFERVAAASGLSEMFAAKALRIAMERAGVDPDTLTPRTLRTALPEIQATIEAFLQSREVPERMSAVTALTRSSGVYAAVKPPEPL